MPARDAQGDGRERVARFGSTGGGPRAAFSVYSTASGGLLCTGSVSQLP